MKRFSFGICEWPGCKKPVGYWVEWKNNCSYYLERVSVCEFHGRYYTNALQPPLQPPIRSVSESEAKMTMALE